MIPFLLGLLVALTVCCLETEKLIKTVQLIQNPSSIPPSVANTSSSTCTTGTASSLPVDNLASSLQPCSEVYVENGEFGDYFSNAINVSVQEVYHWFRNPMETEDLKQLKQTPDKDTENLKLVVASPSNRDIPIL